MKLIHESEVQWQEQCSPKGRFHLFRRHLSEALGAPRDAGVAGGGHPFDVEMTRLPPGAANFPFHAHAAQWEFYIILSGSGEMRAGDSTVQVRPGDAMICPPGEAHQLKNTGEVDLVYCVIADNPPADHTRYPDSGKWSVKPERRIFKIQETEYYDGEE